MNVYFISGLGADRRAFERIRLSEDLQIHHLDWIPPNKYESLECYAKRLAENINTAKPFSIVGLSMGGMLASCMNSFLNPVRTILISSATCAQDLPPYFKYFGKSSVYTLLPVAAFNKPNAAAYKLFGVQNFTERDLMRRVIKESDAAFVKWGVGAITTWQQQHRPKNILHIHGSNDKILPIKYTKADVVINGGSHFMVWINADEISALLQEALEQYA